MIVCKKCGNETVYKGKTCNFCNSEFVFDELDIKNALSTFDDAKENKNFLELVESCHILADAGIEEAILELASYFEKGIYVEKNPDTAMEYYYKAAKKNNPLACYKYSRLASRFNDSVGRFWLIYSAILGCELAYPTLAEEFALSGYNDDANYFYSLAAACDDVPSIVTLAKRYHTGDGIEQSDEYAKWYLSKLKIPPIYAIKLAYKLRLVKPLMPPALTLGNYDGLLKKLKIMAKSSGYTEAYTKLCEILASRGDEESGVDYGELLVFGIGCEKNLEKGLELLTKAAARKNADAYFVLARLYLTGYEEKNLSLAISYALSASELGSKEATELLGDIHVSDTEKLYDVSSAIKYYDLAEAQGSEAAGEKSRKLKSKRKLLFEDASILEKSEPEKAYIIYEKSAAMGYTPAMLRLARLARAGIGAKKPRRAAFSFYKMAADAGDSDAFYPVAICYYAGFGVNRNFKLAIKYFKSAEIAGDERAHEKIIALLDNKVKKTSKNLYSTAMRLISMKKFDAAKDYLEIAANINNPKATYTLGCFLEFGIAMPTDKKRAFELYEKAYALSFRDPRSIYKLSILKIIKSVTK